MNEKRPVNPLAYTVCIRIVGARIEVSQPDLGLYTADLMVSDLKNATQVGELVLDMMDKVRKRLSQMKEPPRPSSPKGSMNIPKLTWVSVPDAALFLDVSKSTIRRLCDAKILRCEKTLGGHRKIPLKDLEDYKKKGPMLFDCSIEPEKEEPLLSLLDLFLDQTAS